MVMRTKTKTKTKTKTNSKTKTKTKTKTNSKTNSKTNPMQIQQVEVPQGLSHPPSSTLCCLQGPP